MAKSISLIAFFCGILHLNLLSQCPDLTPESPFVLCQNSVPQFLPIQYPSGADNVYLHFENDSVRDDNFLFNPSGFSIGLHYLPFSYEVYYSNQPSCFGSDSILVEIVGTQYSIDIVGDTIICFGTEARLFSVEFRNGTEQNRPVFWNGAATAEPVFFVSPSATSNYYYDYEVGRLTTPPSTCMVRGYFNVEVFTFDDNVRASGAAAACESGTAGFNCSSLVDSLEFTLLWPDSSVAASFDTIISANTSFPLVVTNTNYQCDTTYVFDVVVVDQTEIMLDSIFDICIGQALEIYPEGGFYYSINNDSIYLDGTAITLRVDSDSTFLIRALREDMFPECTSEMSFDVRIFSYPDISIFDTDSAIFVSDSICRGELVSVNVSGAEMYDWYSSNSDLSLGTDSIYGLQPDYSTDYFVVGWQYVCSDTDTFHVGVRQLPIADIHYSGPFCHDSLITVWYEESENEFLWQNQSSANFQDWFLISDTVITLTAVDSFGCVNRDSLLVMIHPFPDVEIIGPDAVCAGVQFSLAVSGALQYEWDFGGTDSVQTSSILSDQYFTVTGINAHGCGARDTHVVRALNLPALFVSPNEEICWGESVTLSVFSSSSYSPAIENNTVEFIPQSDTSITFIASNELGCSTTREYHVTVQPLPSIAITGTPDACPNQILTFQAQGAETYYWSISSNGNTASLLVTQDSVIYVNGISSNGCMGSTSFEVNARNVPSIEIMGDDFICAGGTTVLSAPAEFALLWEGVIADSQIVLNNIEADTLINLVATNQYGCIAEFQKWVTVADLSPDVAILGDDSLCAGENTVLTASGDAVFYWFDSLATTSLNLIGLMADSVVHVRAVNSLGCDTILSKTVQVFPYPSIQFDDNLFSCEGQWLTVNANADVPVLWSDGIIAPYRQLSVTADTALSAIAIGINNCLTYDTVQVGYSALPNVSIADPLPACFGDTLILVAEGASSYTWNTGETGNSIAVIANLNQTYTVVGTNAAGCTDDDVVSPSVVEPLNVQLNFSQDTVCEFGGNFALTMNPSGGVLSGMNVFNGIFNPSGPGVYQLTYVIVSPAGCVSTAQDELIIESCVGVNEATSMNGFNPYPNPGKGIISWSGNLDHLQVFNSIGSLVFESSLKERTCDLSSLPAGNYILLARDQTGELLPAMRYTLVE